MTYDNAFQCLLPLSLTEIHQVEAASFPQCLLYYLTLDDPSIASLATAHLLPCMQQPFHSPVWVCPWICIASHDLALLNRSCFSLRLLYTGVLRLRVCNGLLRPEHDSWLLLYIHTKSKTPVWSVFTSVGSERLRPQSLLAANCNRWIRCLLIFYLCWDPNDKWSSPFLFLSHTQIRKYASGDQCSCSIVVCPKAPLLRQYG